MLGLGGRRRREKKMGRKRKARFEKKCIRKDMTVVFFFKLGVNSLLVWNELQVIVCLQMIQEEEEEE